MAVDDDIDALEEELEGLDDDEDNPGLAKVKRFLPVIAAGGVGVLLLIGALFANFGDDDEPMVLNVQDIGPGAPTIKIEPGDGAPVGEDIATNPAYDPMKKGADDTDIEKITPPPEAPVDVTAVPPPDAPPMEGAADTKDAAMLAPGAPDAMKDSKAEGGEAQPESLIAGKPDEAPKPDTTMAAADGKKDEAKKEPEVAQQPEAVPEPKADEKKPDVAQLGTKLLQPTISKDPAPAPSASGGATTPFRTMAGVYRVQVASAKSEGQARSAWDAQVKRFPDVLSNLSLTVQTAVVENRGTFYRVQGGPFSDRDSADSVCRKLKDRGQDCLVVRP